MRIAKRIAPVFVVRYDGGEGDEGRGSEGMAVVSCPKCGGGMKVRDEHLGMRVMCPACKQRVELPRAATTKAEGWLYIRERKKFGPISFPQLKRLAQRGILNPNDMILRQGSTKWTTAKSVPDLFTAAPVPSIAKRPRRALPLVLAAAALLLCVGLGIAAIKIFTTPADRPADPPVTVADANKPPPSLLEVKKATPPEGKKPDPPEEKKPNLPEEKKPLPPEEKKPDPPEEKKPNPPEEKKSDLPEEKQPTPPSDIEPKKLDVAALRASWLERLNAVRTKAGVARLLLAKEASDGCQAHAEYLVRNPKGVWTAKDIYDEDPKLPGYTLAGKNVASRSEAILEEPENALRVWLENVGPRLKLLEPDVREIGVGVAQNQRGGWAFVVAPGSAARDDVVVYPYPGQPDVRLTFSGGPEVADPKANPGFPISALFPQNRKITNAQAWLEDDKAMPVPFWLSTPQQPLRPALKHLVGMIPKAALIPAHSYTAKITAEIDGKEWSRTWTFTTEDDDRGPWAERVLERIRAVRKDARVGTVEMDAELSKGCRLHALYLVRNADHPAVQGLGGHDEDPKLPGYTPEGRKAGKESVIAFADPTPLDAVESWVATLYHRTPLLDPRLTRIGFGAARGRNGMWTTCVHLGTLAKGDRERIICYPEDGQQDVALMFPPGGEVPNPIPDDKDGKAGFPITAIFPGRAAVKGAKGRLLDAKGAETPVWFSSPDKPANSQFADFQGKCVCMIPHDPLAPEQTYRVEMSADVDGKPWLRTWNFTTSKRGMPPAEAAQLMLARLNRVRGDAGLSPIRLAPGSKGCQEHAEYLARHYESIAQSRGAFNDQDPKLPGATPAGREAARSSQISLSTPHPDAVVDDSLGTLTMRDFVLEPRLRRVGFGSALAVGRGWMSVYQPDDEDDVVFASYPHPDQENVPTKLAAAGYPITIAFAGPRVPADFTVRLLLGDKELPLTPLKVANPSVVAVLAPPMSPVTTYHIELRYRLAGADRRHTWKFITK